MSLPIDFPEIWRYLGYRGTEPEGAAARAIQEGAARVAQAARPRSVSTVVPVTFGAGNILHLGPLEVESAALRKNLTGCEEAVLFAATLGVEVDRLMARCTALGQVSQAAICQAAAAALIETYCDQVNDALRREAEADGWYLRPRFSPGYGDFSIQHQRELSQVLRTTERIGLTVSESLMLLPSKSVTAVVGRSRVAVPCHRQGCEACDKTDCPFRRG